MIPNINLYEHSKKIFYAIMDTQYESHRRGYFDFPTKTKWLNDEWKLFIENNPELVGLKYDDKNDDWVHEYENGLIRVII